ncbi:uncharacterized protein N7483_007096 [Penicillium malachiteum]|uniref:uncharacterized protein n=1 Tax=Penicillium malachiteum TaxID=1324776 RepID=UPI002548368E|nr:uncharacterized protein N7483_007096 [Penicillium malachiteum]KAJ5725739.1 hypothetical protein N7483_007096 [Penicillium malachiteum]
MRLSTTRLLINPQFRARYLSCSSKFSTRIQSISGSEFESESPITFPWLSKLKSTELQHLARATGIQSSGTKSVLLERIENTLQNHVTQTHSRRGQPWRILSIDMGIQNLAFTHLVLPCPLSSATESNPKSDSIVPAPEMRAWRRLAVSDIGSLALSPESASASSSTVTLSKETSSDAFRPDLYASTAYTLITTLLSAYNPTHILIERQRFRSGGGSAVQEWTLRVGVFEGMLYAILHALRMERGGHLSSILVEGVEPKRVVGYWGETKGEGLDTDGTKKKLSAREVKKGKIDLVGRWLDSASDASKNKVLVGEHEAVRDLVDAYLRKWKGEKSTSKSKKEPAGSGASVKRIGKLDDLADCLLQGVTWLEWQVMRERLVREGIKALEGV